VRSVDLKDLGGFASGHFGGVVQTAAQMKEKYGCSGMTDSLGKSRFSAVKIAKSLEYY